MPHARIEHQIDGRVRIRVSSKRHDHEYFSGVKEKLVQHPQVEHVETNPRTGSILIRHGGDLELIRQFAEQNGLFTIATATEAAMVLAQKVSNRFQDLDDNIIAFTRGNTDLRSVMLVALGTGAVIQAFRKRLLPPAFNLLWYGLALVWRPGGERH